MHQGYNGGWFLERRQQRKATGPVRCWAATWFFLTLVASVCGAASAAPAGNDFSYRLHYCPADVRIGDADLLSRCDLTNRPENRNRQLDNDLQLLRLTITNPNPHPTDAQLFIGPYYLAQIELYNGTAGEQKLAQGGAFLGGGTETATPGGHVFPITLQPHTNQFLLRLEAPGFAHLSIYVDPISAAITGTSERAMGVGMHLGMLAALTLLASIGLILRPGPISTGLFLLNLVILVQVSLGSGYLPVTLPNLPGEATMTAFMVLIVVRIAIWGALYQLLIQPHHRRRWYQLGCQATYGIAALAAVLYLIEQTVAARALSFVLLLSIPLIHTIAALQAQTLIPLLKRALVGSLIAYNLLQVLAIALLVAHSGQTDLPIYISRVLDLAVPLLAMATVLLRNRATDQQLATTEQNLARKEAQLAAETAAREDKRTLLDMLTHEIRNPLASVRLASKSLERNLSLNDFTKERLSSVDAAVRTIDSVITRCDLHNRMESDGITLNPQPIDLPLLATELTEQYGIADRTQIDNQLTGPVETDGQLVETLLSNLLDNARKYSLENSPVTITLASQGPSGWAIRVCNQVSPEMTPDPDQLFKRYYRSTHARRMGGSGLGLALCKRIAELLGGSIDYQRQGNQVCFSFRIQHTLPDSISAAAP